MPTTARAYAGDADFEAMRGLLRRCYLETGPYVYALPGDIDWWRCTRNAPHALGQIRLWFEGEQLMAFVWPYKDEADVVVHPACRALEPEALAWAERHAAAHSSEPVALRIWTPTRDAPRVALLQARGYVQTDDFLQNHLYDLRAPLPPERPLPPGYTLRHTAGDTELPARVEVHRAAFAPSRMTVEKHRCVRAAPTHRDDLDLVVEGPDGAFAAFTHVWYDAATRTGLFEPVGCHPDHQRRGLAGALLREGLRRLYALGATHAFVNSWRDDSPGALLYRALGFTVLDRLYAWQHSRESSESIA